ncbi:peptide deformylase [Lapidilactobacillus concavus DSM 17758]|uniref:Peptide deformylase n=1 Tax=Lapidilactobacillus concavus DSM 17758 TaxID=1423735 RepID=A0A0R1VXW8_9LACO|nr:peptide deformylase [Lapidilactobacillus concavus DSM 17758]
MSLKDLEDFSLILMNDIVRDGDPVLRQVAANVQFPLSDEDQQLAKDMMEYLENSQVPELSEKYGLRPGVGLAAPQVGVSEMMAAVLVPSNEENGKPLFKEVIINPVIISHSVQPVALSEGEGCLSVDKDIPGYVVRHDRITLRYTDVKGEQHKIRLRDYPAIVCQHEIDHLNGHLYYDLIDKEHPFTLKDANTVMVD